MIALGFVGITVGWLLLYSGFTNRNPKDELVAAFSGQHSPEGSGGGSDMANVPETGSAPAGGGNVATGKVDSRGFYPDFGSRLTRLCKASGCTVFSGARSYALQASLFQKAIAKYGSAAAARKWVAPPGYSMHDEHAARHRGMGDGALAADLAGNLSKAHALAPSLGLVFPMSWEPWHVELAGARAHPFR